MKNAILMQRLEGLLLLVASVYFYSYFNYDFRWFILILVVDVFMAGYLISERIGAYIYNLGHSLVLPLGLIVLSAVMSSNNLLIAGLIWVAHIGLDRALGYGLKDVSGFADTHLGRIGKK